MHPTLDALERYLTDCENKRRRARDRPSNQVLGELRALLEGYKEVTREAPEGSAALEVGGEDPSGASESDPLVH